MSQIVFLTVAESSFKLLLSYGLSQEVNAQGKKLNITFTYIPSIVQIIMEKEKER
jgi:hypothetical protein